MKVKISVNAAPFSGYLNIDPSPIIKDGNPTVITTNVKTLQDVEQAECEELIIDGMIDYIRSEDILNVVKLWCSKLRHGGRIIIKGTDINLVAQKYVNGGLTTPECNELLFGKCDSPWSFKCGAINVEELSEIVFSNGVDILERNVEDTQFTVIGRRR